MSTGGVQRKLAAILCADVEGYSRLMQDDPEATLHTLTGHREVFRRCTENRNGRIVDSKGDNLLIEFVSAIEAVQCAVEIQRELAEKNVELPEERQMRFRIGIDLGDILEKDGGVYGDWVNISSRLQALARSGGICISGRAYEQVANRLPVKFEFLGKRSVKNIAAPVRVYRVLAAPGDAGHSAVWARLQVYRKWPRIIITIAAVLIMIAGASHIWQRSSRFQKIEPDTIDKMASPLPAQPTIAVLPFEDISPGKDQEYFVGGLSEEILNSLSKIPGLNVIARTSSFFYKGTAKKPQEIADELGVSHFLEGSVRKAGDDLRITMQLIRAADGIHLWSETYDRKLGDIFAVQEDIATAVADELKIKLGTGQPTKELGGTDNVEAYEFYLKAKAEFNQSPTDLSGPKSKIDTALELDPEYALAWTLKATIYRISSVFVSGDQSVKELDESLKAAQRAIELEPNLAEAHAALGDSRIDQCEWIEAELAYGKARDLGGQSALAGVGYIQYLCTVGYFDKANKILEEALRNDRLNVSISGMYAMSFILLGDRQKAEEQFDRNNALLGIRATGGHNDILINFNELKLDDVMASPRFSGEQIEHIKTPEDFLAELRRIYVDPETPSLYMLSDAMRAAYFGDPELALQIIESAIFLGVPLHTVIGGPFGLGCWYPVMHDVRQLPGFKEIVREIGLVDYWNEFDWPDICRPLDNGDFECD